MEHKPHLGGASKLHDLPDGPGTRSGPSIDGRVSIFKDRELLAPQTLKYILCSHG